jgi:hypothetical protein
MELFIGVSLIVLLGLWVWLIYLLLKAKQYD